MRRRAILITAALLAAWPMGGCAGMFSSSSVRVMRFEGDLGTYSTFVERPQQAVFATDSRRMHGVAADWSGAGEGGDIQYLLVVRELFPLQPGQTGTDESILNARVEYLIVAPAAAGQSPVARCYEGVGSVFVRSAWYLGSRRQFEVRHAMMKLKRSGAPGVADPLGEFELDADLDAATSPDAQADLDRAQARIDAIPPAAAPK
ncbi:MAG: hypothetical protein BIFFINMI_01839 [Phycisphaerae bacterium]|nr:hypothetical protein [Phycisphaerae bacterium]